eukprot:TRINITY_DN3417_c0_g1_i2.p1 TRINITY_DN3417_c0_g1~~TRINITY_DN3417_c0_g1_i2.p1  ORF type:complete len:101 (-),score=5.81 TRINITY_DN3417_c0_g1_i2:216-518(-)
MAAESELCLELQSSAMARLLTHHRDTPLGVPWVQAAGPHRKSSMWRIPNVSGLVQRTGALLNWLRITAGALRQVESSLRGPCSHHPAAAGHIYHAGAPAP